MMDRHAARPRARRNVKDHVQQRFGDVAANYRTSQVHASGIDLDRMVETAALDAGALVLDAGCGAGHTSLAFAPRAARVIACDFTGAMLEQAETLAQERGVHNIETQLADVEDLPFPARKFDLVVTRYSAHHWPRPQRALREFRRLLKDDGIFLISDIMAPEDYAQDTFLQTIELLRDPSHVRDYRISEWQTMLAAAGFSSDVLLRFDLRLRFDTWIRRMATPRQNADMILSLFQGAPADIQPWLRLAGCGAGKRFELHDSGRSRSWRGTAGLAGSRISLRFKKLGIAALEFAQPPSANLDQSVDSLVEKVAIVRDD